MQLLAETNFDHHRGKTLTLSPLRVWDGNSGWKEDWWIRHGLPRVIASQGHRDPSRIQETMSPLLVSSFEKYETQIISMKRRDVTERRCSTRLRVISLPQPRAIRIGVEKVFKTRDTFKTWTSYAVWTRREQREREREGCALSSPWHYFARHLLRRATTSLLELLSRKFRVQRWWYRLQNGWCKRVFRARSWETYYWREGARYRRSIYEILHKLLRFDAMVTRRGQFSEI